ncbi:hypothetical protein LJC32_02485 [Oscillospiraceae bacterium OttesenSCG-928-F05]|nr:hypothetical protein [Oscillospiraceae bacterium OttesenSCG-928-F05]
MNKKRIRSTLYLERKIKWIKNGLTVVQDPGGFLFADGKYPTKILPEDLPEWFVYGYLYKQHGYISAKGIKHLLYVPNYAFANHLHKDDMLFVSYDAEVEPLESENGFHWYQGYSHVISGLLILEFITAAQKYSGYDVNDIQKEITRKRAWYYEQNRE